MHRRTSRILSAAILLVALGITLSESLAGEPYKPLPEIPTTPTVAAPVAPTNQHHVKFQNLVPGQLKLAEGEKKVKFGENGVAPVEETGPELTLGECIAVALERQPSLKAARASLAASEDGYRALIKFGTVGTIISPDLDIRKQQAQRGLAASAAEYQKNYNEVVQDVTRLYYTAIYAKQQQAVADFLVGQLAQLVFIIDEILKTEVNPKLLEGLNKGKLLTAQIGLNRARMEQSRARIGRQQALAALRQVMAVEEATFPFQIKDKELPVMAQQVLFKKEEVVQLALTRRPELAMAAAGVDAFRLEVYAQGKIPFKRVVPTLASGSDIHSKEIPHALRTPSEYRPGAISPEMPPQLVGSKFDRVCRAMTYCQRAEAVYESARSLVMLEAENTYYEFELASENLRFAKAKYDEGLALREFSIQQAQNTRAKHELVAAMVIVAETQSDYIKRVYEYILALANLERVTAGGIRPSFPGR